MSKTLSGARLRCLRDRIASQYSGGSTKEQYFIATHRYESRTERIQGGLKIEETTRNSQWAGTILILSSCVSTGVKYTALGCGLLCIEKYLFSIIDL